MRFQAGTGCLLIEKANQFTEVTERIFTFHFLKCRNKNSLMRMFGRLFDVHPSPDPLIIITGQAETISSECQVFDADQEILRLVVSSSRVAPSFPKFSRPSVFCFINGFSARLNFNPLLAFRISLCRLCPHLQFSVVTLKGCSTSNFFFFLNKM